MENMLNRLKSIPKLEALINEEEDDSLSDEQILNVFRIKIQEGVRVLKTAEVAEELPITPNWTSKRLSDLEEEGRVHSKSAGQGDVWWLDRGEPEFPIAEGMEKWLWVSLLAKRDSKFSGTIGLGIAALGGIFLIPYLLLEIFSSMEVWLFTAQNVATLAMLAALVAGLFLLTSFLLRQISKFLRWMGNDDDVQSP